MHIDADGKKIQKPKRSRRKELAAKRPEKSKTLRAAFFSRVLLLISRAYWTSRLQICHVKETEWRC